MKLVPWLPAWHSMNLWSFPWTNFWHKEYDPVVGHKRTKLHMWLLRTGIRNTVKSLLTNWNTEAIEWIWGKKRWSK